MQETSELVDLTFYFDQRSRIFLHEIDMGVDLVLEVFILHIELIDHMLLLENLQELFAIIELIKIFDSIVNICLKAFELIQCLVREVLGRWSVVLNTLQVADDLLGVRLLLIDDPLEHVELLVYLLGDFLLKRLLVEDAVLHLRALAKIVGASLVNFLQLLDVFIRRLLQSKGFTPLSCVFEVAIIAQSSVLHRTEDCQFVLVVTKFDLLVLNNVS